MNEDCGREGEEKRKGKEKRAIIQRAFSVPHRSKIFLKKKKQQKHWRGGPDKTTSVSIDEEEVVNPPFPPLSLQFSIQMAFFTPAPVFLFFSFFSSSNDFFGGVKSIFFFFFLL